MAVGFHAASRSSSGALGLEAVAHVRQVRRAQDQNLVQRAGGRSLQLIGMEGLAVVLCGCGQGDGQQRADGDEQDAGGTKRQGHDTP